MAVAAIFIPAILRQQANYANVLSMSMVVSEEGEEEEENPEERLAQELLMLQNPSTKSIPDDIQRKERVFAATLPTREAIAGKQRSSGGAIQAQAWTQRGPFNVGGRTRAFAIDVSNENVMLAGGISGGIWRTQDAGRSWSRVSDVADLPNVSCIAQDTRTGKTNTWYAGTGEGFGNSAGVTGAPYRGDGIYKSTDGGTTWRRLPSTITGIPQRYDQRFDYAWNLATNPVNTAQDEIYAALFECIKRSSDGGTTWITVLGNDNINATGRYFSDVAVAPRSGAVYATLSRAQGEGNTTERGIFRSTDGVRWTRLVPPDFPSTYRRIVIGIAPSNENVVYFLAETPGIGFAGVYGEDTDWHSFWKYTYISGDGTGSGGRWENRSLNLPNFTATGVQGDYVSQASYDMVVRVKPTDENIVFLGGMNLYRSNDGFATNAQTSWIGGYSNNKDFIMYTNHHPDQHAIGFLPSNPDIMFNANDGGIFRTDDDRSRQCTWTPLNNGYVTTQFYAVAIAPDAANALLFGGMQDNGTYLTTSLSSQARWKNMLAGDGTFCAVGANNTVYVSAQTAVIRRQTYNNDFSTLTASAEVQPSGGSFLFVNPFILDPTNTNIMYLAGTRDLWRQNNLSGGNSSTNWTRFANLVPDSVSALGAVALNGASTRLYIGTTRGKVYRMDNIQTGQPTAVNITGGSFPSGYVNCVATDPRNSNRAVVVFSNYEVQSLFYTGDGGATWTAIGGNLEQNADGTGNGPSCRWATILSSSSSSGEVLRIFVGTSTGLYSTDRVQGASTLWAQEGTSVIGTAIVPMVVSRLSDGLVAVATHGNGVFSTNVSLAPDDNFVEDVVLQQNYPNPFSQATTIAYTLPKQGVVSVSVFDVLGRRINTLVNAVQSEGLHQVSWDRKDASGFDVAGGAYWYQLVVSNGGVTARRTGQMLVKK